MSWTQQEIEMLRRLASSLTTAQIAIAINAAFPNGAPKTKNAVISKAHSQNIVLSGGGRLPPKLRAPPATPRKAAAPPPRQAPESRAPAAPPPVARVAAELENAPIWVSLFDVKDGQCRWPRGEPFDIDAFRFCGAAVAPERSLNAPQWCKSHCNIGENRPPVAQKRKAA